MQPTFRASFLAALPGGFLVLLTFFVWHWFNIAPVWTVLVEGTIGVGLASAAIAWAWMRSRAREAFRPPWGGLAFGAVFSAAIVAAELLGLARGPRTDPRDVLGVLTAIPFAAAPILVVAAAGWRFGGGWRGAAAYALAGVVLILYLGGSIVQRGGIGLAWGLFLILFPGYLVAGLLLGWLQPRLERAA